MAFQELPLNNRLLEQFNPEPPADVETYNPNVQGMDFVDYINAEVVGGVEVTLGKYYTRPDSRLIFNFEDPTGQQYQGSGYNGNIKFIIKKANSTNIVNMEDEYAEVLAALGGGHFTVDLSTHDISVGDVLTVELYYEVTQTEGGDQYTDSMLEFEIELTVVDTTATEVGKIVYAPYVARITSVDGNKITATKIIEINLVLLNFLVISFIV